MTNKKEQKNNNDRRNTTLKTNFKQRNPTSNPEENSGAPEG